MPRAAVTVLQRPPYHGDKMMAALAGLGYRVQGQPLDNPQPGDVLVCWNRHESRDAPAQAHEKAGGAVLVVENGYFGRNFCGSEWYAMAWGQHNGAGAWPAGSAARWASFAIDLKPWKTKGEEIVILASRNMGSAALREPQGWSERMATVLRGQTGRQVRVRKHPGPQYVVPPVSLEDDLANAWAAVTWGSSAGLKALVLGVPVFHGFPKWIGAGAARRVDEWINGRFLGDRAPMLSRVAAAMWSIEEIESGEAFRCLLRSASTSCAGMAARSA